MASPDRGVGGICSLQPGGCVVSSVWEKKCASLRFVNSSGSGGPRRIASQLLPGGILARDDIDLDLPIRAAQQRWMARL
ncbi:hypothetical protein KCP73_04300 [Salmonella enterica subsp. enterica]|nr:hypothetical protein KCP73_04300 [Salmonella enterica subsp. enterica]